MRPGSSHKAKSTNGSTDMGRAVTPTGSYPSGMSVSPNRPPAHRVIVVKSEDRSQARRRRVEDHYGRQAFPISSTSQCNSNYHDEFHPKSTTISPAFYPKHNLEVDYRARCEYSTNLREGYIPPPALPRKPETGQRPHLQSSPLWGDMMGGRFQGRTEKQDQYGNYSVVLK